MPLYISLGKNVEIDESMFGTITKTTKEYKSDSIVLVLQVIHFSIFKTVLEENLFSKTLVSCISCLLYLIP